RSRVAGQPGADDVLPGLDEPDRDAGAAAHHRIENLRRQIAYRDGIAMRPFSCHGRPASRVFGRLRRAMALTGTVRKGEFERQGGVAGRLLAWYDAHHRELPWRVAPSALAAGKRPDPYHVWLSEIMLQQTTVEAVKPYFRKFLEKWPRVKDIAAAEAEE